ncbi:MAG: DMT family transporter [Chloroflexi bacterium]|nr:DMT family transporter [Chloroflexota bacterium]MDL1882236.1 DMT family transporter [Anaerolineae bacterium CFX8]
MSNRRAWAFFWLLGLIWGSSFLLMRVGVVEIPPAQLTFTRVGIAAIGMNIVLLLTRRRYPSDWRALLSLAIIGLGNTAVPFTLLAWGEQTVESGMTSIIQAVTPVFALVIAHFAFEDERITPLKVFGIALSFAGIVVLTSRDLQGTTLTSGQGLGDLAGEFAIIGAALCYATFTSFSRKVLQRYRVEPVVVSSVTMTAATIGAALMMFAAPLIGERRPVAYDSLSRDVLLSGLALGFFNTFLAYLVFYQVVAKLGASRTTTVTYVIPVVAVTLGALVLNETIDAWVMAGAALILGGIGLASVRLRVAWRGRVGAAKPAQ